VIKSCSQPANALFAIHVLEEIELFKVPKTRVISCKDPEFKEMQFAMDKVSLGDETLRGYVRSNINRPFVLLMEYIPGFDLNNVFYERSLLLFHPDTLRAGPKSAVRGWSTENNPSGIGEPPSVQIGKIIAADIVMNNPDRMPVIWNNQGTLENVQFQVDINETI